MGRAQLVFVPGASMLLASSGVAVASPAVTPVRAFKVYFGGSGQEEEEEATVSLQPAGVYSDDLAGGFGRGGQRGMVAVRSLAFGLRGSSEAGALVIKKPFRANVGPLASPLSVYFTQSDGSLGVGCLACCANLDTGEGTFDPVNILGFSHADVAAAAAAPPPPALSKTLSKKTALE